MHHVKNNSREGRNYEFGFPKLYQIDSVCVVHSSELVVPPRADLIETEVPPLLRPCFDVEICVISHSNKK